jgi:hypothetical protein
MLPTEACFTVTPTKSHTPEALSPHVVSMFWHCYDDVEFDPEVRDNNKTEYSLFTFDIIKSLGERERDFLIHARLGHLPRKRILPMIKNGTTGIGDYSGKFKELCKPCMQAKQRAENHGREHKRHPNGRPGEHLHSDLAVESKLRLLNTGCVSLSMEFYWKKLMRKFDVKDDKIENSPLKTKIKRSECPIAPDEQLKTSFLQIIGSIIYGYTHCRLDLAFPVNMLTRVMHAPANEHYNLLRKILHYINGLQDFLHIPQGWRQPD